VIPLYNVLHTLYERYHFFGPPCTCGGAESQIRNRGTESESYLGLERLVPRQNYFLEVDVVAAAIGELEQEREPGGRRDELLKSAPRCHAGVVAEYRELIGVIERHEEPTMTDTDRQLVDGQQRVENQPVAGTDQVMLQSRRLLHTDTNSVLCRSTIHTYTKCKVRSTVYLLLELLFVKFGYLSVSCLS